MGFLQTRHWPRRCTRCTWTISSSRPCRGRRPGAIQQCNQPPFYYPAAPAALQYPHSQLPAWQPPQLWTAQTARFLGPPPQRSSSFPRHGASDSGASSERFYTPDSSPRWDANAGSSSAGIGNGGGGYGRLSDSTQHAGSGGASCPACINSRGSTQQHSSSGTRPGIRSTSPPPTSPPQPSTPPRPPPAAELLDLIHLDAPDSPQPAQLQSGPSAAGSPPQHSPLTADAVLWSRAFEWPAGSDLADSHPALAQVGCLGSPELHILQYGSGPQFSAHLVFTSKRHVAVAECNALMLQMLRSARTDNLRPPWLCAGRRAAVGGGSRHCWTEQRRPPHFSGAVGGDEQSAEIADAYNCPITQVPKPMNKAAGRLPAALRWQHRHEQELKTWVGQTAGAD